MFEIRDSFENKRGCGYRKEGGLYLVLDEPAFKLCGKLPLPLEKCPCCNAGIKFSRGWTWINPQLLFKDIKCWFPACDPLCGLANPPDKGGLIWIGEKFYPTPYDWISEAHYMGVSRRIKAIPRGFKVGETWVYVAHIKTIKKYNPAENKDEFTPAIFQAFKPNKIDYVVKPDDSDEKLQKMADAGISLIRVHKADEQLPIPIEVKGDTSNRSVEAIPTPSL